MVSNEFDQRLKFPATSRNRQHIAEVLKNYIPKNGIILEIASGSGEHGVFFQNHFPSIVWQTSDPESLNRDSIRSWIQHEDLRSIMPAPIDLNVVDKPWPLTTYCKALIEGIVCINMIHISPWQCTLALFEEAENLLKKDQFLFLYGPFKIKALKLCESNMAFDQALKLENSLWGIRELEKVNQIAFEKGFYLDNCFKMPANNLSVIYKAT